MHFRFIASLGLPLYQLPMGAGHRVDRASNKMTRNLFHFRLQVMCRSVEQTSLFILPLSTKIPVTWCIKICVRVRPGACMLVTMMCSLYSPLAEEMAEVCPISGKVMISWTWMQILDLNLSTFTFVDTFCGLKSSSQRKYSTDKLCSKGC